MLRLILLAPLAALPALLPAAPEASREDVDYAKDVHPILERTCFECHAGEKQKGGMRFDTREGLFQDHDGFAAVVAGKPDESLLLEMALLPADDPDAMPPNGERLSEAQLGTLRSWIEQGAPWEAVAAPEPEPDPLVLPELTPEQAAARQAGLARLSEAGLAALPIAVGTHALDFNGSLLRERFKDAQVALLEPLAPSLVWVNLSGTAVGDKALASLGRLTQLQRLNLSRTQVTGAGMTALAGLPRLEVLNLYGTAVDDAGLRTIASMGSLKKLYLWQTQVTDEGVDALRAALPKLVINLGVLPPEPEPEGDGGAAPCNEKCPVSGADVDAAHTSEHEGRVVAFCCATCKGKFDADPAAFADKLPAELNATCPLTGGAVDPAQTSDFEGAPVAFCCANCKGKFDADPAAFADKVRALRQ